MQRNGMKIQVLPAQCVVKHIDKSEAQCVILHVTLIPTDLNEKSAQHFLNLIYYRYLQYTRDVSSA